MKPRIFSGMQPSGNLHIGNYLGALKTWTEIQHDYEPIFCIVDQHAITECQDPKALQHNIENVAALYTAAGIDPTHAAIFVQSMVPAHVELAWVFTCTTPFGWLRRMTQFKAKSENKESFSTGLFCYPLLMAADILLYQAAIVPVGEDQVPHLELAREVVRRFHGFFGQLFPEPQPLLTHFPRLPGLDNRKMSKSYANTIDLSDNADTVRKKVKRMYTDPKRVRADIPGTVEGNPVFMYHDAFNPDMAEVEDLKTRYRAGAVGDVEVKDKLVHAINAVLDPLRERREEILGRPGMLREILMDGSQRARTIAKETLEQVRDAVGLGYG